MEVFISSFFFLRKGKKDRGKSSEISMIVSVTNSVGGPYVKWRGILLMMSLIRKFNKGDFTDIVTVKTAFAHSSSDTNKEIERLNNVPPDPLALLKIFISLLVDVNKPM